MAKSAEASMLRQVKDPATFCAFIHEQSPWSSAQADKSFGYRTTLLHFGTFESMGMPLAYRSDHWASMPIAISERLALDEAS